MSDANSGAANFGLQSLANQARKSAVHDLAQVVNEDCLAVIS